MADMLDEFSTELASAETGRPPANPSPAPTVSVTAPLLSIEEILRRDVAITWDEAVAVVEEVCALSGPAEPGVPAASDLFVADSTLVRRDGARVQSDVNSAGRLLHSLLSTAGSTPVPLRLFVTQASAHGTYASIADFAKSLAYFGKPGRRALIRTLYLRCATSSSLPASVRPAEPKHEVPPVSAPLPARSRRSVPRWAVAALAAIVVTAAGAWAWSMRSSIAGDTILPTMVAQARDAVNRLRIASAAEPAASATPSAAAAELRRDAGVRSRNRPSPADAARLPSRALRSPVEAGPRSQRRPRPAMPVLVQPPASAELSARSAEEAERESSLLTIYSGKDAEVDPPVLLHPQIPTNLMLAGENRLNIMELLISETGSVDQVRLVAGPSRLPDVMLLSGAKAWRFKPASRDGEAVRYRALVSWAGTP